MNETPRPLSVLIVDDEEIARRRLRRMLSRRADVEIAGEAADGEEALAQIAAAAPNLVLLDVQMPEMTGLELAQRLSSDIHLIFTTAHSEYALEAFDAAAIDYLLKPITADRLDRALDRVKRLEAPPDRSELVSIVRRLSRQGEPPRLAARQGDTIRVFDPREIARLYAGNGYTIFRHEGRNYTLDDSIASLAVRLGNWGFCRIHRSEIVNLGKVRALRRVDDRTIVELDDKQQAVVSRRRVKALKQALGILDG